MAKTKTPIDAAPRPPTPPSERFLALLRSLAPRVGCGMCGESVCRCNQPNPDEPALQAAGLL